MMDLRIHPDTYPQLFLILWAHHVAPVVSSSGIASPTWWTNPLYLSRPDANISNWVWPECPKWSLAYGTRWAFPPASWALRWGDHYPEFSPHLSRIFLLYNVMGACLYQLEICYKWLITPTDTTVSNKGNDAGPELSWGQFLGCPSSGLAPLSACLPHSSRSSKSHILTSNGSASQGPLQHSPHQDLGLIFSPWINFWTELSLSVARGGSPSKQLGPQVGKDGVLLLHREDGYWSTTCNLSPLLDNNLLGIESIALTLYSFTLFNKYLRSPYYFHAAL